MMITEHSSCGVGFVAGLSGSASHENLSLGLKALVNLEHRGGASPDGMTGDGAGVMADLPRELLGLAEDDALANLFLPSDPTLRVRSLRLFEQAFQDLGLEIYRYREVPTDPSVLP